MRPALHTLGAAAVGGLTAALCALGAPALAQQDPTLFRGGGHAGVETEPTFRFTTLKGNLAAADFDRAVLKVPAHFGAPLAVCPATDRSVVIWYRADDGTLRNVVLQDDRSLVRVTPEVGK